MNIWNQAPLFKALIPLILGILCTVYLGPIIPLYLMIISVPFFIWLLLQLFLPDAFVKYNNRWTTGICIYVLLLIAGYSLSIVHAEINDKRHFSKVQNPTAFIGVITDAPAAKEISYKTTLIITNVVQDGSWKQVIGNCLVYFKKDSVSKFLKYGDEIEFTISPNEVSSPPNPSQFDYKRFLSYRNIYHQVYLTKDNWKLIASHKGNPIVETAIGLRTKLLGIFKENKIEGQDYAVLSALILGDEGEISQDTFSAFTASGTLHVLSVSGMHVGIIFIVLDRLLFFMNRKRSLRIFKSLILMLFLGSYALITGLSPPVLRSAAMLGIFVFGTSLERHKNPWNNLAASAFILLCFNPFYIMDVGFQLSFLSVIGIIFLYKKIFNWFTIKNFLVKEIWSILSASLAAQLATFPLTIYYFHQFPNYFLLSNLIIIPLSTIIIYGGVILLVISKWTSGAILIGRIVGSCVHALNWTVLKIEHLPHALINKISISVVETYLAYAVILLFIFFFLRKQQKYLLLAGYSCCLILIIQLVHVAELRNQRQFIVYDVPKSSAINIIEGRRSLLLADTSLTTNEISMRFNIRNYWCEKGISDETIIKRDNSRAGIVNESWYMKNNFIQFCGKKIVVISDNSFLYYRPENKIVVDYLILSQNTKVKMNELLNVFNPRQIIFDSSNSLYHCNKWEDDCKSMDVKFYSVPKQGAIVINV